MNVSPLRYPGGKTRACKKLFELFQEYFDETKYKTLVSPFFGGGSFEFYMEEHFDTIIANDKFTPLITFWKECQSNPLPLCDQLENQLGNVTKETFLELRSQINHSPWMYFVLNRCSFSGSTLSGGFSKEASQKRFTLSSIQKIKNLHLNKFTFTNLDFEDCLNEYFNSQAFLFLDPPYYLEKKSKLYGNKGDLHENFDHQRLFECLSHKKGWMMTYNSCDYIKELYQDYTLIETSWSYGMNASKQSSEIVILGL
jgi:DNA adenine methylase